jgi:hypothetical protein
MIALNTSLSYEDSIRILQMYQNDILTKEEARSLLVLDNSTDS